MLAAQLASSAPSATTLASPAAQLVAAMQCNDITRADLSAGLRVSCANTSAEEAASTLAATLETRRVGGKAQHLEPHIIIRISHF